MLLFPRQIVWVCSFLLGIWSGRNTFLVIFMGVKKRRSMQITYIKHLDGAHLYMMSRMKGYIRLDS